MKKAADARYYERNKEAIKQRVTERAREHAVEDPEWAARSAARVVQWWESLSPDEKKLHRNRGQAKVRLEVIVGYGGACACCGDEYLPHLTLDHIHGGGSEHRKVEDARSLYRRLRRERFPQGEYQVLCWNCNIAKHHYGECGCQGARLKAVV